MNMTLIWKVECLFVLLFDENDELLILIVYCCVKLSNGSS